MFNHKEVGVRVKAMLVMGFLSMVAATGVINASGTFAGDPSQGSALKRIGQGGSTYEIKSVRAGDCQSEANVAERIGHGGSTYRSQSAKAGDCNMAGAAEKKMEVAKRIGQGGSANQGIVVDGEVN